MKKISLCVHDVRVSDEDGTINIITKLINLFNAPLTIHLVADAPLDVHKRLDAFLREKIESNRLELVFHGLTHACSRNTGRWISFYHKYQAEYLENSDEHQSSTGRVYESMRGKAGRNIGICPPCWLSTSENNSFFRSLNPLYVESIFSLNRKGKNFFYPVISIGSSSKSELIFLRLQARLMYLLSLFPLIGGVRMVIHVCDIPVDSTMNFFTDYFSRLKSKGFTAVFQRELIDL